MKRRLDRNQLNLFIVFAMTCVVVAVGFTMLWRNGKMQSLEMLCYDAMLKLHVQPMELGAANDIAVIGIDEEDLDGLQHYPLDDGDKLALFSRLIGFGARSIAVDLYMNIRVGDDARATADLHSFLKKNPNVTTPCYVGRGTYLRPSVQPLVELQGQSSRRYGFTDQPEDSDGVCRRALLYEGDADYSLQALSLGATNQFLERSNVLSKPEPTDPAHYGFWSNAMQKFRAGDGGYARTHAPEGFIYLIDFRGPERFTKYSLRQVIPERFVPERLAESVRLHPVRPLKREDVANKIVVIGMTAASVKDYVETPIHRGYGYFGVYHHATLIDQLIRTARDHSNLLGLLSSRSVLWYAWSWTLAGASTGLTARFGFSRRAPARLLLFAVAGQIVIVLASALAFHNRIWIPIIPPSFCWLISIAAIGGYVTHLEFADRKILDHIFVRLVQKEVAAELWTRRGELIENGKLRPRKLDATLMFTDVAGFTRSCEKLNPPAVIDWINKYHAEMTAIVTANSGVVVRYMGDGMMAVFGAPTRQKTHDHALSALRAAVEMRGKLQELLPGWEQIGLTDLAVRVGINTGEVVEGSIGSTSRFEYVILGDATNTAARLEQLDKKMMNDTVAPGRCRILISEATLIAAEDKNNNVKTDRIGEVSLHNKATPVVVYAVLDIHSMAEQS